MGAEQNKRHREEGGGVWAQLPAGAAVATVAVCCCYCGDPTFGVLGILGREEKALL